MSENHSLANNNLKTNEDTKKLQVIRLPNRKTSTRGKFLISLFNNTNHVKDGSEMSVNDFLDKIRNGWWQGDVDDYRKIKNLALTAPTKEATEAQKDAKKKLTNLTLSGKFSHRSVKGLIEHSGFIGIDLDNLQNVDEVKSELNCDEYVYSSFISCGGAGLCVIFKIDKKAHSEAFLWISAYLLKKYGITEVDQSGKDVSRTRFVSYDPELWLNEDSNLVPAKALTKTETKAESAINRRKYSVSDATSMSIIEQIVGSEIDITGSYKDWVNLALALSTAYGEEGREHFHSISKINAGYNFDIADKKYTNLNDNRRDEIPIDLLYYLAEKNGIKVYSEEEKTIIKACQGYKRAGLSQQTARENLKKFCGLSDESIYKYSHSINQVFEKEIAAVAEGLVPDIKAFISNNYSIRSNAISRNIELEGVQITDFDTNTMYLNCKALIKDTTKDLVKSVIYSNFTERYNPFFEFVEENKNDDLAEENLNSLIDSIKSDTPNHGLWIKKWLIGVVASIYDDHSPLMLVLCGGQNTGKTEWFRRLLPPKLKPYYAESKFMEGKDDEILMATSLIILDDELSGKSKGQENKMKSLLSKKIFNLREPYGTARVNLKRLAVLCGTTNHTDILTDLTGNRRFLPINVVSIDHQLYNEKVNKNQLFIECYNLYRKDPTYHHLTKADIELLYVSAKDFEASSREVESISNLYALPDEFDVMSGKVKEVTVTDMVSKIKLVMNINIESNVKMGLALRKMGFEQVVKKEEKKSVRKYKVVELSHSVNLYT